MNATRGRHWMLPLLLMGLAAGISARGEDKPAPSVTSTNGAVAFTLSPPALSTAPAADPVVIPPPEGIPVDDATPLAPVEPMPTTGYTTDFGLETPAGTPQGGDAEAQSRLQAPSPEQIIADHGAVGFLIRQPEPRNLLELINPFAPEDFGTGEREVYNRDPNLRPGATLPRTFINDITHEPVMNFWNWAW